MKIHGLQKLTLLDYPGRVACTVFLGGCDFRCPYCHNSELLHPDCPTQLEEEELLSFLGKRRGLLDGVCITGGEPLLRPDLPDLLEKIRALGYPVKLDTNGSHPQRLRALLERGLADYVAMDIKNSPARYAQTVGVPGLDPAPILESAALLMEGSVDYEFRTTVVRGLHDEDSFRAIGPWLAGAKRYFLQSFQDRDTVPVRGLEPCSQEELAQFLAILRSFIPAAQLRES